MKYSILLVIKPNTHHNGKDHNNLERFITIGMPTYEKYMKLDDVQEFLVIVPKPFVSDVQQVLQNAFPKWPWKVMNEDTFLHPSIPPGWARQQTIKLAVSMIVKTPYYLIIDDDTYLTKPFVASDMLDNGKVIMNKTDIDFPFFFLWSAQVLKADFDKVQTAPCHMGITPEIFITSEVSDLVRWLVATYGSNKLWQLYLADHKFTEYCLYWIWLMENGKADKLYATDSSKKLYDYATTGREHNMDSRVQESFKSNTNHWFSFVQSSLDIPVDRVRKSVMKHL